jgi:hypothetical protein
VNRKSASQVWQQEGFLTISAVSRADQLEEHFVLCDRESLPFTKHPSGRSKVAREHPDLTHVWLAHGFWY